MKRFSGSVFLLLIFFPLCAYPSHDDHPPQLPPKKSAEEIRIQLKWHHQFQFAGYYAAKEKGFYADYGLNVTLCEYVDGRNTIGEVISGRAEYGIAGSEILLERVRDNPVVVIAVIFQHSPSVILSLKSSNIATPHDLINKKIMIWSHGEPDLRAMLLEEGVTADKYHKAEPTWDIEELIDGRVDAMSAYITNLPYYLDRRNIEYNTLNPRAYGVDFYGDCLFTTESEVKKYPERTRKFREASLKGWEYAMDNVSEMIDIILTKYSSNLTRARLEYEAEAMREIILPDLVQLGHINPGRWDHIAHTYEDIGMISSPYSLRGFLYDSNPAPDLRWLYWISSSAFLIFFIVLIYMMWLWTFNRRLQNAVRKQTTDLRCLNEKLKIEISEQKRAREDIMKFSRAVEQSPAAVVITDPDGNIEYVNPKYSQITGYSMEEVIGKKPGILKSGKHSITFYEKLWQTLSQGKEWKGEFCNVKKDGQEYWDSASISPIMDAKGEIIHFVGVQEDITEKKVVEQAIKENESKLRAITESVYDAIAVIDSKEQIVFWNPAAERIFGYTAEEVLGHSLHDLIVPPNDIERIKKKVAEFSLTGQGRGIGTIKEFTARRKDGSTFPAERSLAAFRMNGEWWAAGTVRDITDRKKAEAKLKELATIDSLTKVYNRRYFMELSKKIFENSKREGLYLSLIMLDADHFKSINDTYGHAIGDKALVTLTEIGRKVIRNSDVFGRVGGEEFVVLLPETDLEDAVRIAERLREAIEKEVIQTPKGIIDLTVSIGASMMDASTPNVDVLLNNADKALYEAKKNGRNTVKAFS